MRYRLGFANLFCDIFPFAWDLIGTEIYKTELKTIGTDPLQNAE